MLKPRAFVIMPFGTKDLPPEQGQPTRKVNFDDVYNLLIKPALDRAGCAPFRADESYAPGDILTGMFYELLTADLVVADESIPNANVYYECGIRDAARRNGFIPIHGNWSRAPFDRAVALRFEYDGHLWLEGAARDNPATAAAVDAEVERLATIFRKVIAAGDEGEGSLFYHELPGLSEPDASELRSTQGKYFASVCDDLEKWIALAQSHGLPGDILTLADDAPTRRHWKRVGLRAARAMMNLQRFAAARDLLLDLREQGGLRPRDAAQIPLAYARLGQLDEARQEAEALEHEHGQDSEVAGILGSVYKEMWRSTWEKLEEPAERLRRAADMSVNARLACESYLRGLWKNLGSHWLGINVLAMRKLLEHVATATARKIEVPALEDQDDLPALVRFVVNHELRELTRNEPERVWALASRGELAVLTGGSPDAAAAEYRDAANTPGATYFNIDSMRRQLKMMALLGFQPAATTACLAVLDEALAQRGEAPPRYARVFVCSGHMTDAEDRSTPRFPQDRADDVRVRVEAALDSWKINAADLAICGGARGADILFAEACRARGAHVRLLIPLPEPEFVAASLRHPKGDWVNRYHALKADAAGVEVWFQHEHLGSPRDRNDVWERNNRWIINTARTEAPPDPIYAVLVWDEKPSGDGKGGTSHFAKLYAEISGGIDPVVVAPL